MPWRLICVFLKSPRQKRNLFAKHSDYLAFPIRQNLHHSSFLVLGTKKWKMRRLFLWGPRDHRYSSRKPFKMRSSSCRRTSRLRKPIHRRSGFHAKLEHSRPLPRGACLWCYRCTQEGPIQLSAPRSDHPEHWKRRKRAHLCR